jgi:AmpD protein
LSEEKSGAFAVGDDGWLRGARPEPTDNADPRPEGEPVSLLVLHNISLPPGEFGGQAIEAFFCNRLDCSSHPWFDHLRELRVSAHLLIRRDGESVQFVPFQDRAWHAGRSIFEGKLECNDYSIGIELEGTDDDPYTPEQYQSLIEITRSLMTAYPLITPDRIVGHDHVAPERKTDPGPAFDWAYFLDHLTVMRPTNDGEEIS